jgi:tetratricopeptide (TPR) repeat protein
MPSREPATLDRPLPPPPRAGFPEKTYQRLLAFLDLSSGFSLAVAIFSSPSVRDRVIARVRDDGAAEGIAVYDMDISLGFSGDIVRAIQERLPEAASERRCAVLVRGLDTLLYGFRSTPGVLPPKGGPTPLVAQLNFDRERIAASLSFPVILCLEPETYTALLLQAPDLSQWVMAHFEFEGAATTTELARSLSPTGSVEKPPPSPTSLDVSGLLKEIEQTPDTADPVAARKRFALVSLLAERYESAGDVEMAESRRREALELAKRLGDRSYEVSALFELGLLYSGIWRSVGLALPTGPHRHAALNRRAIEYFEQASALAHEMGDRRRECFALGALGLVYGMLGEHARAIEYHRQELTVAREIGDRRLEGDALRHLGITFSISGEQLRAIEYHKQALVADRDSGDLAGEAEDLTDLSTAHERLGDFGPAAEYRERALAIHRKTGDRLGAANDLANLGIAYASLGEYRRAIGYHEQSLAIHRELGDRRAEATALGNLGNSYGNLGEYRRAIEYHEQALAIHREIGDRWGEGQELGRLGIAYGMLGESRRALEYCELWLSVSRKLDDRRSEALALFCVSAALYELGERGEAIVKAEAALKIFEQIEDPNAAKVRKQLEEWGKAETGDERRETSDERSPQERDD